MNAKTYKAEVPSSIAWPSDPEDQSPDYDVTVEFEWTAGTPPSGLNGPPENYDPGSGDEFYILSPTEDADGAREEAIIEWLDENWERPDVIEFAENQRQPREPAQPNKRAGRNS